MFCVHKVANNITYQLAGNSRTERRIAMIELTKRDGTTFILNCDLIETISEIPETKIALTNDRFYLAMEPAQEVVRKIIAYRQKIYKDLHVHINKVEVD